MGYDLTAHNMDAGDFHFGAFSWGPLVASCGTLWPFMLRGGQWYCVWGVDERMPHGDDYPRIISNDGMVITEEEAKIMARCARNLVAIQRSLPDENADQSAVGRKTMTKDSLMEAMTKVMTGEALNEKWPVKLRADFVDGYEKFADWAEKSGGFKIH